MQFVTMFGQRPQTTNENGTGHPHHQQVLDEHTTEFAVGNHEQDKPPKCYRADDACIGKGRGLALVICLVLSPLLCDRERRVNTPEHSPSANRVRWELPTGFLDRMSL